MVIVYGVSAQTVLNQFESLHNESLRLWLGLGAFKATPVERLYVLMNEPSVQDQRKNLMCIYYYKNKCHILSLACTCVLNQQIERFLTAVYHE